MSLGEMGYPEAILKSEIRLKLAKWTDSNRVQNFIIGVILINAVVLGLETSDAAIENFGQVLKVIDQGCLLVFVVELLIKLFAFRRYYFSSSINWFDFAVVAVSLVPGGHGFSVLRALRIFRVLRLFTAIPQLRSVLAAFLHAIPGLFSVIIVMAVFFFTMGVLATNLFGDEFPEWFGTLGRSLYTLFQIMTLESWSMGIVRPVMEKYPFAWLFFIPFIIVATFTILNLFIGIIVSSMQELTQEMHELTEEVQELAEEIHGKEEDASDKHVKAQDQEIVLTLSRLEDELKNIRIQLERKSN